MNGSKYGCKGFTLVELIIVLVVLSIASMMAIPMMSSASSSQLRSAANLIAADIEYAKSFAISRGQLCSVVFDEGNESYRILDKNGNLIEHPFKRGSDFIVEFKNDGRLQNVDITAASFDGETTISFDSLASPYSGAGLSTPMNVGTISLSAGGNTAKVNIEPVTGFVTISD